MLHASSSVSSPAAPSRSRWRKFGAETPAPHETVEIRRLHDDKTILRSRADLPPSFDWRHAEWRPI